MVGDGRVGSSHGIYFRAVSKMKSKHQLSAIRTQNLTGITNKSTDHTAATSVRLSRDT